MLTAASKPATRFGQLRLYVAGQTPKSLDRFAQPQKNLRRTSSGPLPPQSHRPGQKSPARPRRPDPRHPHAGPQISPRPIRKIIGDLSDTQRVLVGLERAEMPQVDNMPRRAKATSKAKRSAAPLQEHRKPLPAREPRYQLRLYVTGQTPRSIRSVENLRALCDKYLRDNFDLQVIDIYQQPAMAAEGTNHRRAYVNQVHAPAAAPPGRRFFRLRSGSSWDWISFPTRSKGRV